MGQGEQEAPGRRRAATRAVVVSTVALVALLSTPAAIADPPVLSGVPADQTLEATSAAGAELSWPDPTTSDGDGNPTTVACSPPSGTTFPIATTSVSCTATDTVTLDETSQSFSVTVRDTTPPAVVVPSGVTVAATGPPGAVVTFSASASDIVDGAVSPGCSPTSGSTFPLGSTTVTCSATDSRGNTGSASFSVTVQDSVPPTVTVPGNIIASATGPAGAAVTFSASASDAVDTSPALVCVPPSGSTFPLGATTVTCTATDDSGNSASASFTVTVQDTTPPTVNVPANITVEATGPAGSAVTFSATASDAVDPSPGVSCGPPSGSTFPLGTTTVSCTATDTSGNTSAAKTFTITVRDTVPPVITVPSDLTVEATGPSGAPVSFSTSASDVVAGVVAVSCTPGSGATFKLGTTTVTCTAGDGRGNTSSVTFKVSVRDTVAPVFGGVPTGVTAEADGPGGSRVTYAAPSAVDVVNGPVLVACAPSPGSLFALGESVVTCTSRDGAGNTATVTFPVRVVDTTKPALNAPQPLTVSSRGASTVSRSDPQVAVFLDSVVARDIVDGLVPVQNDAPAELALGATRVTFTAKDRAGNTATAQSTLTVVTSPVTTPRRDTTPPKNVTQLKATPGDRSVLLTWVPPKSDFHHVTVTRSPGRGGATSSLIYRGSAREVRDAALANGTEYRYVVVTYDKAGNFSPGVVARAVPVRPLLYAPVNGALVAKPPVLRWARVPNARYYNVQLYRIRSLRVRATGAKILSAWPARPSLALGRVWRFEGRVVRLTPGAYRWFVWPGFGPKSANRYGAVLGQSAFIVRPPT